MCVVQEAKRAALCHSTGRKPAEELTGPGTGPSGGDGGAQRTHQPNIEVQVMDSVEAGSEDLVAAVEMPQVGAAEVAGGGAVAGRGQPRQSGAGRAGAGVFGDLGKEKR